MYGRSTSYSPQLSLWKLLFQPPFLAYVHNWVDGKICFFYGFITRNQLTTDTQLQRILALRGISAADLRSAFVAPRCGVARSPGIRNAMGWEGWKFGRPGAATDRTPNPKPSKTMGDRPRRSDKSRSIILVVHRPVLGSHFHHCHSLAMYTFY